MTPDHEIELRQGALEQWGEAEGLVPEEIERLQALDPESQDREVKARNAVFVPEFVNHYHCEDCDESWSDGWCCACDDECPSCGDDYSPEDSEVVGVEILRLNHDVCSVCGAVHDF